MYVSLVFGICSFVWLVSLMNFMHKQEFVVQKSLIYFIFFAIVFIPLFHLIFLYRLGLLGEHFSLINIEYAFILSALPLSIGLFVYTYRVPERWYPKKYDIWVSINNYLGKQPYNMAYTYSNSLCNFILYKYRSI